MLVLPDVPVILTANDADPPDATVLELGLIAISQLAVGVPTITRKFTVLSVAPLAGCAITVLE